MTVAGTAGDSEGGTGGSRVLPATKGRDKAMTEAGDKCEGIVGLPWSGAARSRPTQSALILPARSTMASERALSVSMIGLRTYW